MRKCPAWKSLLLTLPMALGVEVPTDSTSSFQSTMLKVAGGRGDIAFVIRDCDGQTISAGRDSYTNYGLDLRHRFDDMFAIGLRSGYLEGFDSDAGLPNLVGGFGYFNPYLSVDFHYVGFGAGYFASGQTPLLWDSDNGTGSFATMSSHLRVGPRYFHFASSFMEGMPIYTTGYFDMGLEAVTKEGHSYWFGFGSPGPYDTGGVMTKLDFKLGRGFGLNFIGRVGKAEGITEYGVATGLSYTMDWK